MPHYCIGDIQGCFQELESLLSVISFDQARDKLWFTGDLVNRGPDSLSVLRFIKSLGQAAVVVLGNHDLHLLALASGQGKAKKQDTLEEVLKAPDLAMLCDWLRKQPLLHHDAVLDYTLVHAGLPPQWDLQHAQQYAAEVSLMLQSDLYQTFLAHLYGNTPHCWDDRLNGWPRLRLITNYLTRMRFCDKNGSLELLSKGKSNKPPKGYMPWFKVPERNTKNVNIVFGHWAALCGRTDEPNVHALDTGCVWGKCLTAMRLEDKKRFQVPCA
jgi:bis(5'-nucleosyl)-tetraphosphatase (symmetrical)